MKTPQNKVCRVCSTEFSKPPHANYEAWNKRECCSKVCGATHKSPDGTYKLYSKICKNPICREQFNKSKKDTHSHFAKQEYCSISCSKYGKNVGDKSHSWVGDKISYAGVHTWMQVTYGKPQFCDHCKTTKRRMYHWANISDEYKRDRNDWYRLCVPCHRKFDKGKI